MRVFIFGASGMLGSYLFKYLEPYFEVVPITRKEIDLNSDFSLIDEKYNFENLDVIINAAGIIKQRNYSSEELIRVNSLFPHYLSTLNCNVIHITTDCVFSGKDGSYNEDSLHDCLDDYGKSKSLGECENITVIRTSIIGEELRNKKSLIEWVKSNQNKKINGYLNHFWNGVTCLELAKHIKNIIENQSYWKGIRHYFSPDTVSKYQLVSYINEVYKLNNEVNPVMSEYCDRSLSTKYNSPVTTTIKDQIIELQKFSLKSLLSDREKLKNFPSINFVSITESEERRNVLQKNCKKLGIAKVVPHIFEKYVEGDHEVDLGESGSPFTYAPSYIGAMTSHLKAIKEWYENTDEEYTFFCEDDLSFDTVKYWNFTWKEFYNKLPKDWECIQLALSRDDMFMFFNTSVTMKVHFRSRCWCDWSCVGYLIKRSHAKNLLDHYYKDGVFSLEYKGIDREIRLYSGAEIRPIIETMIYTVFKNDSIFTFPLFVENRQFDSTVWTNERDFDTSRKLIMDCWESKGKEAHIDEIFYQFEEK